MVDNVNPTSQFHPYQPQDAVPVADRQPSGGLAGILNGLGIDRSKLDSLGGSLKNVNLSKARTMAQNNGGLVLGGLAALAIGAGLLRGRR
jgi:hypothetical protein